MKYTIEQHGHPFLPWNLSTSFVILDENAKLRFTVKDTAFTLGDQYLVQSPEGQPLASIRQNLFSWLGEYEISMAHGHVATITQQMSAYALGMVGHAKLSRVPNSWRSKRFFCPQPAYQFEMSGPNDYSIIGTQNLLDLSIQNHGQPVAELVQDFRRNRSRNIPSPGPFRSAYGKARRRYTVDIADGQDDLFILCLCLVMIRTRTLDAFQGTA